MVQKQLNYTNYTISSHTCSRKAQTGGRWVMSKFLGIGGKDNLTGTAHVASVNSDGDLGFANTIGQFAILEYQTLAGGSSVEVTLTNDDIPKGTTYIGYFLGKTTDVLRLSLTIDNARYNSFGRTSDYIRKTIDFGRTLENYAILPRGSDNGFTRITVKNRELAAHGVQLWVVFYRTASPVVVGEEEKDTWEDIRTFETTVGAFGSVDSIGTADTSKHREVAVTVRVDLSHEFSINNLYDSVRSTLVPRGLYFATSSDVFQAPALGRVAPEILNHSDSARTYTITVKARK